MEEKFDENYWVPWVYCKENITAWRALNILTFQIPNKKYEQIREDIAKRLIVDFWDQEMKQCYEGFKLDADTEVVVG